MLLYSTILEINETMTKDAFIQLVIKWNQSSPHKSNIIENLVWKGERNTRYGNDMMSLTIEEYRNKNIIAVRYEKTETDGAIWYTDYVMNFNEMRMAIQLDRSYIEEASLTDTKFSTPHFVSMLVEEGYLKNDFAYPVSNKPLLITEDNMELITAVINGEAKHKLPIVYVSKTVYNENPVDVAWLSSKLKGIAHVLLQDDVSSGKKIRELCQSKNEYYGAVGIYYPNVSAGHVKYLYHRDTGHDSFLLDKIVKNVFAYSNVQNIGSLYTWQGVRSALLSDRLLSQREERAAAESAQQKAENEVEDVYATFDKEIKDLQRQVEELSNANEALRCENLGLRAKMESIEAIPILYLGSEDEFYPGEIKNIVLEILGDAIKNIKSNSRRADVVSDVYRNNDYKNLSGERQQKVKNLLKSYDGMSKELRQELKNLGFEITEDGKHYKLTYCGDRRYWTTLSKTPSDYREGINAAKTICRDML